MAPELLAKKRSDMGVVTFATQMLLDPKKGLLAAFTLENLRYWPADNYASLSIAILGDPASKKKKTSDYTSIWVLGLGSDSNWYVLDHIHDRLNLKQRVTTVIALHRKWKPKFVGWEEYGMQADIEAIEWQQGIENYRFDVTPLGGSLAKEDRIARLNPLFEDHRLYFPEGGSIHTNVEGIAVDTIRRFVNEEYLLFPVCLHDDALDSLSRIEDEEVKANVQPPVDGAPLKSSFMDELMAEHYGNPGGKSRWMGM